MSIKPSNDSYDVLESI